MGKHVRLPLRMPQCIVMMNMICGNTKYRLFPIKLITRFTPTTVVGENYYSPTRHTTKYISTKTPHVSRITPHVSRLTFYVSRFTHHVLRITHYLLYQSIKIHTCTTFTIILFSKKEPHNTIFCFPIFR